MPFSSSPRAEPLSGRAKRVLVLAGVIVAVAVAGVVVWSAVSPGGYGSSKAGCITVTLPSSTGGALLHQCGTAAKVTCHNAYTHGDKLSVLTRPQCRLAGLKP
ncbi:MAG TPA: hypothetical protein VKS82_07790 [Streptosporangiaceae bacterium]|jgi:hypothetical protein|nr:hypothetical protein [Streptosporangiaceae bacterium]